MCIGGVEAITCTQGGLDLLTDLRLCGPQSPSENSDREKLYCARLNSKIKWTVLDSIWNVMAHGDAREGKWRGNWRMEWVASTLHTTSEHGVSSFTTAEAHTSAASSRLIWRPHRFKWTRAFLRKTNSGFCACAITFQLASRSLVWILNGLCRLLPRGGI